MQSPRWQEITWYAWLTIQILWVPALIFIVLPSAADESLYHLAVPLLRVIIVGAAYLLLGRRNAHQRWLLLLLDTIGGAAYIFSLSWAWHWILYPVGLADYAAQAFPNSLAATVLRIIWGICYLGAVCLLIGHAYRHIHCSSIPNKRWREKGESPSPLPSVNRSNPLRKRMTDWAVLQGIVLLVNAVLVPFLGIGQFDASAMTVLFVFRLASISITFIAVILSMENYPENSRTYITVDNLGGTALGALFPVGAATESEGAALVLLFIGLALFAVLWSMMIRHMLKRGGTAVAGAIRGTSLLSALQQRGYDWLSDDDARHLWEICGDSAFKLPPWDDVGTLPGVKEGDLESLSEILLVRGRVYLNDVPARTTPAIQPPEPEELIWPEQS